MLTEAKTEQALSFEERTTQRLEKEYSTKDGNQQPREREPEREAEPVEEADLDDETPDLAAESEAEVDSDLAEDEEDEYDSEDPV